MPKQYAHGMGFFFPEFKNQTMSHLDLLDAFCYFKYYSIQFLGHSKLQNHLQK